MAEHQTGPLAAKIEDVAWMHGSWLGTFGDDRVEEQWSEPACGTMMGMFRWIKGDKVYFFELITMEEEAGGVVMRIKHFYPGLKGWEEKDESVTFDLTETEGTKMVLFRRSGGSLWLTYQRTGDQLEAWFEKAEDPNKPDSGIFRYRRA